MKKRQRAQAGATVYQPGYVEGWLTQVDKALLAQAATTPTRIRA